MDTEREYTSSTPTKFCKHCGQKINVAAVICPLCGCQVEAIEQAAPAQPNIVINNTNTNVNKNINGYGHPKNKWVAFLLCLFLGEFGAHKFYEGKIGMGIIYLLTVGLFGIGWFVDCIRILFRSNPYYV